MSTPIAALNPNVMEPFSLKGALALDFLENPYTSTVKKVLLVAALCFPVLAVGHFFGLVAAANAAAFMGLMIGALQAIRNLKNRIVFLEVELMIRSALLRHYQFPPLNLGDRESETGEINFIQLNEVQYPRKGIDKYGRPFYAFTVEERSDPPSPCHVVVVYQKYVTGGVWAVSGPEGLRAEVLTQEGRDKIALILRNEDRDFTTNIDWILLDRDSSRLNS